MKKQWMYFFAGAGLMGAVMSFTIASKHDAECKEPIEELRKQSVECPVGEKCRYK